jgi:hypothetical protein
MAGSVQGSIGHGWGRGDSAAGAGAEMVRVAVPLPWGALVRWCAGGFPAGWRLTPV